MANNYNLSRAPAAETAVAAETAYERNCRCYSNIVGNEQEGSSYSLMVNIPKMNGNSYNEWAQTARLVLDNKGKLGFLTGALAEPTTEDLHLDEVRGRVLGKVPLPTLHETFAKIRREEARQGIMMGKTPRSSESEGKPPNWKKKSGRAFQASNSDQGQQPSSSQFPFTTEQLDRPYKFLESPTPSCSIATKGNSAFRSVSPSHTWIVDSGEMIGSAKESGGLYYLDIGSASQLP
ncbi:hypothetical protein KIW84_021763 [Lathyrus oleraceus]|uniref:Retrotransposon Copia-like N-terminal domain-containing protein n=1 Tax=Pisum sativum TaxID=3888 RepID=A0A9D5B9T1_PEA|nr:hypothetical protein KIW84_021763 [Pisum sativum]